MSDNQRSRFHGMDVNDVANLMLAVIHSYPQDQEIPETDMEFIRACRHYIRSNGCRGDARLADAAHIPEA